MNNAEHKNETETATSKFLKSWNVCRRCGTTENVFLGCCDKCRREVNLTRPWEKTKEYVLVPMRKEEYEEYYRGTMEYDNKQHPMDEDYLLVYVEKDSFWRAKENHIIFESKRRRRENSET